MLQAASDAYEERKVPLLGNLYASLAFEDGASRPYANYLIALARNLTFRQLALMAVIWEGDARPLVSRGAGERPPKRVMFSDELGLEVDDLEGSGLVGRGLPGGTFRRGGTTFVDASGLSIESLSLTLPGKRVYQWMNLAAIPQDARAEVLAGLEFADEGRAP